MRPNTLTHNNNTRQKTANNNSLCLDARNHYPTLKHHTPPPSEATTPPKPGPLPQNPTVCRWPPTSPRKPTRLLRTTPTPTGADPTAHRDLPTCCGARGTMVLLRKEVIQPHLPVRLPCYDFVPIADPTFDSSLPTGLGHWLRVLPTFMT